MKEARHLGLALPRPGGYAEYGYGEWDWYARGEDAWYDVFRAALVPSRGTLSRRITAARDPAAFRRRYPGKRVQEVRVERAKADALAASLGDRYRRHLDEEIPAAGDGELSFTPDDRDFWCCFDCNDATADWLDALDCRVSGAVIRTDIVLREDADAGDGERDPP